MEINPIKSDADYRNALREISRVWGAAEGTPESDVLEVMVALVEVYEAKHFPMPKLDPIETIIGHMEWNDYTQSDLAKVLGSRSRASEILNRKRPLTLEMIHTLYEQWGIPPELLVRPYNVQAA